MSKVKDFIHLITWKETSNTVIQFFRYFITSGLSFVVDFSILWSLTTYLGVNYLVSTPIAYLAGMLVNYVATDIWVFKGRKNKGRKHREFSVFLVIGLSGMVLNQGMMFFFTEILGFFYMVSRVVSAAINYVLKFWARKKWVFNKSSEESQE